MLANWQPAGPLQQVENCNICKYPSWEPDQLLEAYSDTHPGKWMESARGGCLGCRILYEAWSWAIPEVDRHAAHYFRLRRSLGGTFLEMSANEIYGIDVFTLPDRPRLKHVRCAPLLPASTRLDANMSRIASWIRACEEQHATCRQPTDFSPPRLLELGTPKDDSIRLVTAKDVPYICLSHCWGKLQPKHKTTSQSMAFNTTGIPVDELPRTFQDAINVTKALGLKYLWIDSLCIIQDDVADWQHHCQIMGEIYRCAYLTVAAGASYDSNGGLFADPPPEFVNPHCFTVNLKGTDHEIYVRHRVRHSEALGPDRDWSLLPLMTRGWTLQERILSRRFLCFGRHEIFWECLEDASCTCSVTGGPFNDRFHEYPAFSDHHPMKYRYTNVKQSTLPELATAWRKLISEYSTRHLTVKTDKLPALDGIAAKFKEVRGNTSLTWGLWSDTLREDMVWHINGGLSPFGRPRAGPSWSWVSAADVSIEWKADLHSSYAACLQSLDTHGAIPQDQGGKNFPIVNVSGVLIPMRLRLPDQPGLEDVNFLVYRCEVIVPELSASVSTSTPRLETDAKFSETLIPDTLPWSEELKRRREDDDTALFYADYRFWPSQAELKDELQDIIFCTVSKTIMPGELVLIGGFVLKPDGSSRAEGGPESYRRIGFLEYFSSQAPDSWKPSGIYSYFHLV